MALSEDELKYKIDFSKYVKIMDPPIFILLSFFFMLSIYQQDLKFLIYIGFVIAILLLGYLIGFITNDDVNANVNEICGLPSFFKYSNISHRSSIIIFSSLYCLLPMFYTSNYNYVALGVLAFFSIIIIGTEVYSRFKMPSFIPGTNNLYCTSIGGTIKGIIMGLAMGFVSFAILQSCDSVSLMYFGESETENKCSVRESKYKCTILNKL